MDGVIWRVSPSQPMSGTMLRSTTGEQGHGKIRGEEGLGVVCRE